MQLNTGEVQHLTVKDEGIKLESEKGELTAKMFVESNWLTKDDYNYKSTKRFTVPDLYLFYLFNAVSYTFTRLYYFGVWLNTHTNLILLTGPWT